MGGTFRKRSIASPGLLTPRLILHQVQNRCKGGSVWGGGGVTVMNDDETGEVVMTKAGAQVALAEGQW